MVGIISQKLWLAIGLASTPSEKVPLPVLVVSFLSFFVVVALPVLVLFHENTFTFN